MAGADLASLPGLTLRGVMHRHWCGRLSVNMGPPQAAALGLEADYDYEIPGERIS